MKKNKKSKKEYIERLLEDKSGIKLDIGCGDKSRQGFVGLDKRDLDNVDIVWDVEDIPWPLPDECVIASVCQHLVEHLNPHGGSFIDFMNEVWRITRSEGQIAIVTPYGMNDVYIADPTHCNPCNELTWAYFDPEEKHQQGVLYRVYRPNPWKIESCTYNTQGNMEVVMRKREWKKEYEKPLYED